MRSSTGAYYVGLDHLRALAALLVFEWHFIHAKAVPFEHAPSFFPAAIVDEGHCGVALFMCLSGYLFAKLLDGKQINYSGFIWNRFIRLAPLLTFVILIAGLGLHRNDMLEYSKSVLQGVIYPTLPNGGWSITAEAHFYIVLPLILLLLRRNVLWVILIVVASILLRAGIYFYRGEIQTLAYWTIIGRIDQFVLGVVAFGLKSHIEKRHLLMLVLFVLFASFYWYFESIGGFYEAPSYPSPYPTWIILPTVEALFFSSLIAYYDTSFVLRDSGLSALIAKIGAYSYSIYLTHYFYVFWLGDVFFSLFQTRNFYAAALGGLACFLFAAVLASFSYRYVELPFLQLRRKYVTDAVEAPRGALKPTVTLSPS
jgi:peptidoglycan/LPS O-acetylase OafA/YrhL